MELVSRFLSHVRRGRGILVAPGSIKRGASRGTFVGAITEKLAVIFVKF